MRKKWSRAERRLEEQLWVTETCLLPDNTESVGVKFEGK